MQPSTSMDSEPINPFYHTETKWTINLQENGTATHEIIIDVFNPEGRYPTENLLLRLPVSGTYRDFRIKADNVSLARGTGYIEVSKTISLAVDQLIGNKVFSRITLNFIHEGALTKIAGFTLFLLPIHNQLKGSIVLQVVAPPIVGYKLFWTRFYRFLQRKPLYIFHQIDLPPISIRARDINENRGSMIYNLDTGIITPGVAFQGFTKPSIYSVVVTLLGFIYAVIQIVAAIVS